MLRVSFSPVPECVVSDCWKRPFQTPPCHQSPVVVVVVVVIVIVLYPAYLDSRIPEYVETFAKIDRRIR